MVVAPLHGRLEVSVTVTSGLGQLAEPAHLFSSATTNIISISNKNIVYIFINIGFLCKVGVVCFTDCLLWIIPKSLCLF